MPLAATAHPDHIQVLHINHGKAEPYAQACPGHFRMVLSVDLLDDCVLNNDRKRKTKFQSCDETTTASVLKNTANSLFLPPLTRAVRTNHASGHFIGLSGRD
jgi:hypothetical protein